MNEPVDDDLDDVPALSSLFLRLGIAMVGLLLLAWLMSTWTQGPITLLSERFIELFGIAGVFIGIAVLDAIPGTFHEPLLIMAWEGGLPYGVIVGVAGTASVLAGAIGWTFGRLLGRWAFMERLMSRYRVGPFMRRYGGRAVAIAAVTPFPYAVTTWSAGAAGVPFATLLIGSLFRYIKVALYLGIMVYGWSLGT